MKHLDDTLSMLKELTDVNGIAGNEGEPRKVMRKLIEPYADSLSFDGIGSLIAEKTGKENGPRIMIAGHLDEVGFMVTRIDDKGFLFFQTIGGWWSQVMLSQRVTVTTSGGEQITGLIGSSPPHILTPEARKKPADVKNMFIDIGATSRDEVLEWGIRPGDMVTPYSEFTVLKNEKMLMAKAWDNRIGCAVAIEVLKRLEDENHPNTVFGVGTVQEEVGLRGAKTAANYVQPDIAIAVDVGVAADTPGLSEKDGLTKAGDGPGLVLYDASLVTHKGLRDFIVSVAEEMNIPYQFDHIPGGGTDAGSFHVSGTGVPSIAITIPTRYIHSNAGILNRDDYENTVNLIVELVKRLNRETVDKITFD